MTSTAVLADPRPRASQSLYRALLFSGICGYEIAAGLTSIAGVTSTPLSVTVRVLVVCCALTAIVLDLSKASSGSRRLILGYCLFWYLYLLRIGYATTFSSEQLGFPAWYYCFWALGACAFPMLGLSLWSPRQEDGNRNFLTLFAALALSGALASFGASSMDVNENNELVETGRLQLTSLNPILLGQLGTTLLVMAVWALANVQSRHGALTKLIFFSSALIGAGLLIGANSRGPLLSAAACLLFIAMASSRRSRLYAMAMLLFAVVGFVPAAQFLESEYGFSTYTRLFGQSQFTEENTLDRLSRYRGAIDAFMQSPLFGSSLEEPVHGGYPHNLFIEALMATGLAGAILLAALIASTLYFAVRLYAKVPAYGWVSVLFIQYLFAAQFSGSIYTVNYLWLTAGLVIAIHATLVDQPLTTLHVGRAISRELDSTTSKQ